jgi:hypothetical protein
MNPIIYDLLLVALSVLLSWWLTHRYYLKSMKSQETEQSKQIDSLKFVVEKIDSNDETLIKQNYIDAAVAAWKIKGTAVHYLNSLTDMPNELKSEILISASLRHKGREPKNNPYV